MKKVVLALSIFFFFILMSMELVAVNGIISKLKFTDATCKGQQYEKDLTNGQTIYLDSFTEFTIVVYCDLGVGTSPRDFALKEPDGTMHYADDKTTEWWTFGPFYEPGTYRGYVDFSAIDVTVSPTVAGKVDYVKVDYLEQGVAKSLNMTTANSTIFYFDQGTEYELTIYRQSGVGTTPYLFRVLEIPMGSGVDYKKLSTGSSYYMGGFSAENTTMTAGVDVSYGGSFVSFLPLHASPATYMLTVNLGAGTNGTPSSSQSYTSGTLVSYSYSLQAGYQNLVVQLDGTPVPASGSVTMNGPHTLSVSATPISNYLLTVTMGAGTSGSPSSSQSYASGTSVPYSYSLQTGYQDLVVRLDGVVVAASGSVSMNDNHTLNVSATPSSGECVQQNIFCGGDISGIISESDCDSSPRGSGYYTEKAVFSGSAGEVIITADWDGFDGYLYLTDSSGTVLTYNDDYNSVSQSQIIYPLSSSGTYIVWLTTYWPGDTGTYSLSLNCDFSTGSGIVDFNHDGKTDLLWRHVSSGKNVAWYMNGVSKTGSAYLPTQADLNWDLVANPADFNSDGKTDLLWRHMSTGKNVVWYMDGVSRISSAYLPTQADMSWELVECADLNNDGNTDLLWRHATTGKNVVWYMNGAVRTAAAYLPMLSDMNWVLAGSGDFNSDGKADVVWRNVSTGQNAVWYMNGNVRTGSEYLPSVTTLVWQIIGCADFNGDNKPDILWRSLSTGQNVVWYMNGASRTGTAYMPIQSDMDWELKN